MNDYNDIYYNLVKCCLDKNEFITRIEKPDLSDGRFQY